MNHLLSQPFIFLSYKSNITSILLCVIVCSYHTVIYLAYFFLLIFYQYSIVFVYTFINTFLMFLPCQDVPMVNLNRCVQNVHKPLFAYKLDVLNLTF